MVREEGLTRTLEELEGMGVDASGADERTLRQADAIRSALESEAARKKEAWKAASGSVSISRVAELAGISRQTIHGKPLLLEYTKAAIAAMDRPDGELERLRDAVASQERAIDLLVARDGQLIEATIDLREARAEVEALRSELDAARQKIADLRKALKEAEERRSATPVIPFRRNPE